MTIPERYLDELTERNDIVDVVGQYVRLSKKSGANYFGLCPFHSEKTPSFAVNPSRQIYHCFGCGKGGGVISFIMEIENLEFPDAVAFLARRVNMPPPEGADSEGASRRKVLLELNRDAARFFYAQLTGPQGDPARDYVARRGISAAMVKNFGLGYAPDTWSSLADAMEQKGYSRQDLLEAGLMKPSKSGGYDAFRNRLMFPVIDVRGSVIGFSGRILGDGEPKYLNSPETPVFSKSHNLFGLNLAKKSKNGYIILVEGNIDVVSLHQAGFNGAVASLGTALTPEQARLIARFTDEVVLCYDSDEAGRKATARAIGILSKLELKVRVLQVPGAKDPDEFIQKNGPDAFRNLIEGSAGQVEYRLRDVERLHPPEGDEGRVDYLKAAVELLSALPGSVEREVYARVVAEKAKVTPEGVLSDVEKTRKRRYNSLRKKEAREQTRPAQTAQPAFRSIRYDDPRSARAEEGLIRLLYLDPSLARGRTLPEAAQFSSPVLGKFYAELLGRIQSGESLSLGVLAGRFTPDEVSHLTSILSGAADLQNADKALDDYIRIIAGREDKDEDLRQMAEQYRKTKAYGGTI